MSDPSPEKPTRRRLDPEARRQEIIEAARPLFSERPISEITTADVAEAAGVSRALVHSYFGGGIRNVFFAVIADTGAAMAEVRLPSSDLPLEQRLAVNVDLAMTIVDANRAMFWGVIGHRSSGDKHIDEIADAAMASNVQQTLDNNAGLIDDTPAARAALHAYWTMTTEVARAWFTGAITRPQAHALLTTALRDILTNAIPAMEAATGSDPETDDR